MPLFARVYNFIVRHTCHAFIANRYYNWHFFVPRLNREWREQLEAHYTCGRSCDRIGDKQTVIFLCNGFVDHGGWADRLRGILSVYAICKELGLQFRLLFSSPFPLTDYLVPNEYDWRIDEADVIYDCSVSDVIALQSGDDSSWQGKKQYDILKQSFSVSDAVQIHVYTNAHSVYGADYGRLFHELFKPSLKLQSTIDKCLSALGQNYISVSARFIGNLGDFTDTQQAAPLPQSQREELLRSCVEQVGKLHLRHPDAKVLVCSDSISFLNATSEFPYTYIYNGKIVHLDTDEGKSDYELYEKTFVDFMLIAGASTIYRLETRWVRKSGFPYAASRVNERPFCSVRF